MWRAWLGSKWNYADWKLALSGFRIACFPEDVLLCNQSMRVSNSWNRVIRDIFFVIITGHICTDEKMKTNLLDAVGILITCP